MSRSRVLFVSWLALVLASGSFSYFAAASGRLPRWLDDELNVVRGGEKKKCTSSTSGKKCNESIICRGQAQADCTGECFSCTNNMNSTTICSSSKPWDVKDCEPHVVAPNGCGTQLVDSTCRWVLQVQATCECVGDVSMTNCAQFSVTGDDYCKEVQ